MGQVCVFVGLESELLVVSDEFKCKDAKGDGCEDVVRSREIGVWLEHRGDKDRGTQEKE